MKLAAVIAAIAVILLSIAALASEPATELVVLACFDAGHCSSHIYGETFATKTACWAASQQLAASWQSEHLNQRVVGIVCRPQEIPGIDL